MRDCRLVFICLLLSALMIAGCEDREEERTISGLQERNRVLGDEIAGLKEKLQQCKDDCNESVEACVKRYEQKLADAESKLASLRLELGAIQREKLVLKDLVESGPRVQMAKSARFMAERLVYLVLIGVAVTFSAVFFFKWKRTSDRFQHIVMQEVSDLRRIGASQ